MRRRVSPVLFALNVLAGSVLVGAVALSFPVVTAAPAGATPSAALTLANFAFSPQPLTITAGTEVLLSNQDTTTHTWTSDPGDAQSWDSGPIAPGSAFSVTFPTAGTFGYHCNIHPSMVGTIVVVAAPATTVAPAPAPTTPPTSPPAAPQTTTRAVAPAAVAATPAALPRTGSSGAGSLAVVALTLTLVGGAFAASGTRRRRHLGD